ncbi:flavin-nucleotide-binding protein [Achromobacter spanius]|uniref:Flavin-nucleotide-binding protein n=1 Tax=Achromobacter spanius TaxID=217203 RepID=A0A2S5GXB9_9BURK|nr:pyridoxamine 5'-phosphate oxidase family protein [Achromobacter spanius]PPA77495.1 flavin-nucleotide-binding protein [Achromobacter spanius]HCQ46233.1 pyridoxamine 5'-phosphate oxidase family protein [Achromobacter sp.]
MHIDPAHLVTDAAALQALYGAPGEASLKKEVDHVHPHYRAFIEAAPFAMLATSGPDGLDASPRGDPAGFVVVEDEKTLLLPDRRGNNRVDSLLNVLADPRVALLFLVPGVGETLRVNGTARVSVDPALLERFAMDGKQPRSVLIVDVQTVYFQCSRALLRSRLWDPATQVPRSALPSTGRILSDLTAGTFDGAAYDRDLPARVAGTLY